MRFFLWLSYAILICLDWYCVRESILECWYYSAEWYQLVRLMWHVMFDIIIALLIWRKGIPAVFICLPFFIIGTFTIYQQAYGWYWSYALLIFFMIIAIIADRRG